MCNEAAIKKHYKKTFEHAEIHIANEDFIRISKKFYEEDFWKEHLKKFKQRVPVDFKDKIVLDLGCKFGHLIPLLIEMGAKQIYCIDVNKEYIDIGKATFGTWFPNVIYDYADDGFLPIPSETVDIIIVNEVISHINPMFLEFTYQEMARILTIGGILYISDGNNLANPNYYERRLMLLYEIFENGPSGATDGHHTVDKPFIKIREEFIKESFPNLDDSQCTYLAKNTFGLYGDQITRVVKEWLNHGKIIERQYRPGIPVTHPETGAVHERGFYPDQVIKSLTIYGLECYQWISPVRLIPKLYKRKKRSNWFEWKYYRVDLRRWQNFIKLYFKERFRNPGWPHNATPNLTIIGKKKY